MSRLRRFRSPHTFYPHAQFLSNGSYVTVITNAGGGASQWRGLSVTRWREDRTTDPGSYFIYLRDVRSGRLWSATYQPIAAGTRRLPGHVLERARGVSPHRRRHRVSARGGRLGRRGRGSPTPLAHQQERTYARDRDHELRRDRARRGRKTTWRTRPSASCSSRPSTCRTVPPCSADAGHAPQPRRPPGPSTRSASMDEPQSPTEWESSRARFLGRGRGHDRPISLDGRALSGTTGAVLDPVVSLRQRVRLQPGGFARLSFATGVSSDRETARALAQKYHDSGTAARAFSMAYTHSQMRAAPSGHHQRARPSIRSPRVTCALSG